MTLIKEFTLLEFRGMDELGNAFKQSPGYASDLRNIRPEGDELRKIKGNALHSSFGYKLADRPITLIRWTTYDLVSRFLMTAWDNVFQYDGSDWNALLLDPDLTDLRPTQLLYYTNEQFDYIIYESPFDGIGTYLYLADGKNKALKIGTGFTIGTWGLHKIAEHATLRPNIAIEQTSIAGALAAGTYNYYVSLYDSTRDLEGNVGTLFEPGVVEVATGPSNMWVFIDPNTTNFNADGNYDFDNQFADKIRIYRSPEVGGGADTRRLLGSVPKGVVTKTGTISIAAGTGFVTGVGTKFLTDSVQTAYCLSVGGTNYRITIVPGNETGLTVVDNDGSAYSGGAIGPGESFKITGGILDATDDISGNDIYFGDDTTLTDEYRDHSPPPLCKYNAVMGDKNNRAFVTGNPDFPSRVWYSRQGYVDYFPADNYFDVDPDGGDENTGIFVWKGLILVTKRNSMAYAFTDGDPYTWAFKSKVIKSGVDSARQVALAPNHIAWVNHAGIWLWTGDESTPLHISHDPKGSNVAKLFEKIVKSELARAQTAYYPERNELWFSVCLNDERGLYDSTIAGKGVVGDNNSPPGP